MEAPSFDFSFFDQLPSPWGSPGHEAAVDRVRTPTGPPSPFVIGMAAWVMPVYFRVFFHTGFDVIFKKCTNLDISLG